MNCSIFTHLDVCQLPLISLEYRIYKTMVLSHFKIFLLISRKHSISEPQSNTDDSTKSLL